jgi:hypothetical protein
LNIIFAFLYTLNRILLLIIHLYFMLNLFIFGIRNKGKNHNYNRVLHSTIAVAFCLERRILGPLVYKAVLVIEMVATFSVLDKCNVFWLHCAANE